MSRFDGRVAIVTGGATGIGAATCRLLSAEGAAVVVGYGTSRDAARALVAELETGGTPAIAVQVDVRDDIAVRALVAAALDRFGRIDHLVNNAGATRAIPFKDLDAVTAEDWDNVVTTNLVSAFLCSRAASEALRASRGSIVNVASISGHRAIGSSIPYGVSKAGLVQLTRSLALALSPEVRVNSVSPGTVSSEWHDRLMGAEWAAESRAAEGGRTPLGSVASPEDVGDMIVNLLAARLVTGEDVIVDGGKHLRY